MRLEQADVDRRVAVAGRQERMDDLDARPAHAFQARQLGVHRRDRFGDRASQRGDQALHRPPDLVDRRAAVQRLEVLGALAQHPQAAVRVEGDLRQAGVAILARQQVVDKAQPADQGDDALGQGSLQSRIGHQSQPAERQADGVARFDFQLLAVALDRQRQGIQLLGDSLDDLLLLLGG